MMFKKEKDLLNNGSTVYIFEYGRWIMDQPRIVHATNGTISMEGCWPPLDAEMTRALAVFLLELVHESIEVNTIADLAAKWCAVAGEMGT
jgi:hypothetical protein